MWHQEDNYILIAQNEDRQCLNFLAVILCAGHCCQVHTICVWCWKLWWVMFPLVFHLAAEMKSIRAVNIQHSSTWLPPNFQEKGVRPSSTDILYSQNCNCSACSYPNLCISQNLYYWIYTPKLLYSLRRHTQHKNLAWKNDFMEHAECIFLSIGMWMEWNHLSCWSLFSPLFLICSSPLSLFLLYL